MINKFENVCYDGENDFVRRRIMSSDKYVAYVSTYTMGDKRGIKIYASQRSKGPT